MEDGITGFEDNLVVFCLFFIYRLKKKSFDFTMEWMQCHIRHALHQLLYPHGAIVGVVRQSKSCWERSSSSYRVPFPSLLFISAAVSKCQPLMRSRTVLLQVLKGVGIVLLDLIVVWEPLKVLFQWHTQCSSVGLHNRNGAAYKRNGREISEFHLLQWINYHPVKVQK